jgi:hypothetical protein
MLFTDLLRDPLTRLMMRRDGVTKREMIVLERRVRSAMAARDSTDRYGPGSNRAFRADRQRAATTGGGV